MSELLSSADLTRLRADIEAYTLPDTCNILSLTRASDSQGGWTESWGTATAGVACRLDAMSGAEGLAGGARREYTSWVLTVPQGTTLDATMKIEHSSNTYKVTSVTEDESWSAHVRAEVEKV